MGKEGIRRAGREQRNEQSRIAWRPTNASLTRPASPPVLRSSSQAPPTSQCDRNPPPRSASAKIRPRAPRTWPAVSSISRWRGAPVTSMSAVYMSPIVGRYCTSRSGEDRGASGRVPGVDRAARRTMTRRPSLGARGAPLSARPRTAQPSALAHTYPLHELARGEPHHHRRLADAALAHQHDPAREANDHDDDEVLAPTTRSAPRTHASAQRGVPPATRPAHTSPRLALSAHPRPARRPRLTHLTALLPAAIAVAP